MFQIAANAGPDNRVEGEIAMNELETEYHEDVAIRTGIQAGESQIYGSGSATGGNNSGDTDPGRNGIMGSGT